MRFDARRRLLLVLGLLLLLAVPTTALMLGNAVEDSHLFASPISGGTLNSGERFGASVAKLSAFEPLVGSPGRDDGGTDRGAVWILNVTAFDAGTL